jgi:hypothetical protein
MFRKVPSILTILTSVFALHCLPTVLASDAGKNNLLSNTTTSGALWISINPEDLQPIAGTSWLIIFHLDDFEYVDRLVLGDEIFTFEDDTVYLECYDQLGYFWGIAQYGELSSQGGKNGYFISYYVAGESDTDGEFFFWDFIKTNGLETGTFVIEDESTGESEGPLPNIGIRIHEDFTPFVTPDVTGDDRLGLADVIWSLQTLSGLK